jgi:hypothetical protein
MPVNNGVIPPVLVGAGIMDPLESKGIMGGVWLLIMLVKNGPSPVKLAVGFVGVVGLKIPVVTGNGLRGSNALVGPGGMGLLGGMVNTPEVTGKGLDGLNAPIGPEGCPIELGKVNIPVVMGKGFAGLNCWKFGLVLCPVVGMADVGIKVFPIIRHLSSFNFN